MRTILFTIFLLLSGLTHGETLIKESVIIADKQEFVKDDRKEFLEALYRSMVIIGTQHHTHEEMQKFYRELDIKQIIEKQEKKTAVENK